MSQIPWKPFVTQPPYSLSKPAAQALHKLLAQAYPDREKARRLAGAAGLLLPTINFDGDPTTVWYRILERAGGQGRVPQVVLQVAADPEAHAYHRDLHEICLTDPAFALPGPTPQPEASVPAAASTPGESPVSLTPTDAYADFDLRVEQRDSGGYRAHVDSAKGEATEHLDVDPHDPLWAGFLPWAPGQGTGALRAMGQRLFAELFPGAIGRRFAASHPSTTGTPLRIRLRLADAAELATLPWEFLEDPHTGAPLALSIKTPIVRHPQVPQEAQPLAAAPPLQVLVVLSTPHDLGPLDAEGEWQRLQGAVAGREGRIRLHRLDHPSLRSLRRTLSQGTYHVLHFVGHGTVQDGEGQLLFEDAQGRSKPVSARNLKLAIDGTDIRLAVLNACQGAQGAADDVFSSCGAALIRQGLPAAVAMRYLISSDAALAFVTELYDYLADGAPLERAVAEGRKAISFDGNEFEWGTPVLYLRAKTGRIFDLGA